MLNLISSLTYYSAFENKADQYLIVHVFGISALILSMPIFLIILAAAGNLFPKFKFYSCWLFLIAFHIQSIILCVIGFILYINSISGIKILDSTTSIFHLNTFMDYFYNLIPMVLNYKIIHGMYLSFIPIHQIVCNEPVLDYLVADSGVVFSVFGEPYIPFISGINYWFIVLTHFVMYICFTIVINKQDRTLNNKQGITSEFWACETIANIHNQKELITLTFIYLILLIFFTTSNLLWFILCYESILWPIIVLMLLGVIDNPIKNKIQLNIVKSFSFFLTSSNNQNYIYISRRSKERLLQAIFSLYAFTIIATIPMLYYIIIIQSICGTLSLTDIRGLYTFSSDLEKKIAIAFFIGLAVKVPVFPLHIWLPKAHVEAPTIGSIILAALILKMSGYGFILVLLPLTPIGVLYYKHIMITICLISALMASLTALRQIDIKRVVAYSSIGHMSYAIIGILTPTVSSVLGAIYAMLAHGIISSGLFLLVGILYQRFQTKDLYITSSIKNLMPFGAAIGMFLFIANMAFPGTANFIAEFAILLSIFNNNHVLGLLSIVPIFLTTCYNIWLATRLFFGAVGPQIKFNHITGSTDLTAQERKHFLLIIVSIIIFGLFPNIILTIVEQDIFFIFR